MCKLHRCSHSRRMVARRYYTYMIGVTQYGHGRYDDTIGRH